MRNTLTCLVYLAFSLAALRAQTLELVTTGPMATTASDARSCNFVDVNGDGWDDIFISNGPKGGQNNMLFINQGDGSFQPLTGDPIVRDNGASDGATFADVDNDGDLDAFVVTWYGERNYFYLNKGDGTFTFQPEPGQIGTFSETAAWGDYDNDGLVDLYITNSSDFATNSASIKRNQLYHNLGSGQFERITTGPMTTDAFISRSANWTDYDGDGDLDLFVTNEENQRNNLYITPDFTPPPADQAGLPFLRDMRNSISGSWADTDNDGDLELFVANFGSQKNQLFRNDGNGAFTEIKDGPLVNTAGYHFSSAFADYDNDGDLDLFVTQGYAPAGVQLHNRLYRNDGNNVFTPVDELLVGNTPANCFYGCAWGDYNNDGFLDLIVATCNERNATQHPSLLYRNTGNGNHWLKVRLTGTASNGSAIGAKLWLKTTAGEWQLREVSSQPAYCSQNSLTQHFGLGAATTYDSLRIEWPSGQITRLGPGAADQLVFVEEGGASALTPPPMSDWTLRAWPNPGAGQLWLELSHRTGRVSTQPLQLTIRNAAGALLRQQWLRQTGPTTQWQLDSLPANGLYLLELTGEDWRRTVKVVVSHE